MLQNATIGGLNHVLRQQDWARARLQPFAGRTVRIESAPLPSLRMIIREDGLLALVATEAPDSLIITIKPAAAMRMLCRDEGTLRDIELSGAADLAQVAQQLFRELRWDAEEDLSRLFGDVIAHRMATDGRSFITWQADAAQRLARNFADYFTEEQPLIVSKADAARFGASVNEASQYFDALERRISALERSRPH